MVRIMESQTWTGEARRRVVAWIADGHLHANNLDAALDAVDGRLPAAIWRRDVDRLLLGLGILLSLVGLLVFIAANWEGVGKSSRFILVESVVVMGVSVAWWRGLNTRSGTMGVITAAVAVGPLFALIGQTYQTGADPWQLFAVWCGLIVPWVVIARTPVLVILMLALANTALALWNGDQPRIRLHEQSLAWLGFLFNGVALVVWEMAATRVSWLDARWACRLPALASLVSATGLALAVVIDEHSSTWYDLLPMGLMLCTGWWAYRIRRRDLGLLAAGALALLTLIAAGVGRLLIVHANVGGFLITGMIVTGLTAGAAIWLRKVSQETP